MLPERSRTRSGRVPDLAGLDFGGGWGSPGPSWASLGRLLGALARFLGALGLLLADLGCLLGASALEASPFKPWNVDLKSKLKNDRKTNRTKY